MRPDAEPLQQQSSPTPVPPASPAPPASPVPKKGGAGRKVLVGVGAVVLVAGSAVAGLAGGVVHGGATLQPPDDGAAPSQAEEPAEAEAEASVETGERVEFRGMSVLLPEGWAAETVTDEFGTNTNPPEEPVVEEWMVLYPEGQDGCDGHEWSWTDTTTGCAHLKILGPQGIQYGSGIPMPIDLSTTGTNSSFRPHANATFCPEGVPTHTEADPNFRDRWEVEKGETAQEPAGYASGSSRCVVEETLADAYVEQRLWLLAEDEILVVDNYRFDETDGLIASVQ